MGSPHWFLSSLGVAATGFQGFPEVGPHLSTCDGGESAPVLICMDAARWQSHSILLLLMLIQPCLCLLVYWFSLWTASTDCWNLYKCLFEFIWFILKWIPKFRDRAWSDRDLWISSSIVFFLSFDRVFPHWVGCFQEVQNLIKPG